VPAATSLFDRVGGILGDAGVLDVVQDQIGKLSSGSTSVSDLASHPPAQIAVMVAGLDGLTLPQIDGIGDAVAAVQHVVGLFPTEDAELTAGITEALQGLLAPVTADLVAPVQQALGAGDGLAASLASFDLAAVPPS
jgi:hypothetical protein